MDIDFKRDFRDLVTVHDKASEEKIASILLAEVPDSAIVGEEGGQRGEGRVHWHIDPIDGTSNFARGIAHWCVSIAAIIDERIVAGVIFNPNSGDMFSADLTGAWLGDGPIRARGAANENRATIMSVFPSAREVKRFGPGVMDAYLDLLGSFQSFRCVGSSALNLAHVAAGWTDATLAFDTCSWDIAAGILILEQAGGSFHGLRDGKPVPVPYTAPDYYATVGGADYPTLHRVMETYSARH